MKKASSKKTVSASGSSLATSNHASGFNARDRLLKSAEALFAKKGFRATTVREIAVDAGVNLAAIGYYFRGKEQLFTAVYESYAIPRAEERFRRLKIIQDGRQPSVEEILKAWLLPRLERGYNAHDDGLYPQLTSRLSDEQWAIRNMSSPLLKRVQRAFVDALQQCLPQLSRKDLYWRLHFTIGAIQFVLRAATPLRDYSDGECDPSDFEGAVRELLPYAVAGFSAPEPTAAPEGAVRRSKKSS
jgi:AcrR family transcriptional regulator